MTQMERDPELQVIFPGDDKRKPSRVVRGERRKGRRGACASPLPTQATDRPADDECGQQSEAAAFRSPYGRPPYAGTAAYFAPDVGRYGSVRITDVPPAHLDRVVTECRKAGALATYSCEEGSTCTVMAKFAPCPDGTCPRDVFSWKGLDRLFM
jgi:hypothetical protein